MIDMVKEVYPLLSDSPKVSSRTSPEVADGVADLVTAMARDAKFLGRKIGIEAVVGCLLLEAFESDLSKQIEIVRKWIPRLEKGIWAEYRRREAAGNLPKKRGTADSKGSQQFTSTGSKPKKKPKGKAL